MTAASHPATYQLDVLLDTNKKFPKVTAIQFIA